MQTLVVAKKPAMRRLEKSMMGKCQGKCARMSQIEIRGDAGLLGRDM